jgi:hypothetical protein
MSSPSPGDFSPSVPVVAVTLPPGCSLCSFRSVANSSSEVETAAGVSSSSYVSCGVIMAHTADTLSGENSYGGCHGEGSQAVTCGGGGVVTRKRSQYG